MTNKSIILEEKFAAHNYNPLPVVLVRAEGVYTWDDEGKRYIDMMSAYSAVSFGHCHPQLLAALIQQAQQLDVVSRAFYTDKLGLFLEYACHLTKQDKALAMNSGAEAVETAIKAARKWGYKKKQIPEDKAEIIVCANNFHGRTTTIISFSTESQYRDGFGPLTPGFKIIPFGDFTALEAAITPNTAAFLVEPIQGESGINLPPEGYLKECLDICHNHQVLLFVDEIQTGLGRTGKLFAYEHDGIHPDGLILGKALGGGLLPVSLFLSRNEIMDVFTPGDHGSTFGGNPIAAAVGYAALKLLIDENLVDHTKEVGDFFISELNKIKNPLIKDIRGKGLFIGVEINPNYCDARTVALQLLENGLLTKDTHGTVIRLCPPLIINRKQIKESVSVIQKSLDSLLQQFQ